MIDTADPSVIGFERTSPDGEQSLLVLANMSGRCVSVALPESCTRSGQSNLLSTKSVVDGQILLDAFEIAWLV